MSDTISLADNSGTNSKNSNTENNKLRPDTPTDESAEGQIPLTPASLRENTIKLDDSAITTGSTQNTDSGNITNVVKTDAQEDIKLNENNGNNENSSEKPQDIFTKPKITLEEDSKIISSVLATKQPLKAKPILGNAAALQKSIREEQQDRLRRKLKNRKTLFAFTFLAVLAMTGYFMTQFTPSDFFPRNKTAELTDLNTKVRSAQTQFNKYRYLIAQLHLNSFSYLSDTFFDKTDQLNRGGLDNQVLHGAASEVSQSALDLPEIIRKVRDALTPAVAVQTFHSDAEPALTDEEMQLQFENDLRSALNEEKNLAGGNSGNAEEAKMINNTLKLVGNKKLMDTLKQTSVDTLKKEFISYASQLDDTQRDKLQQLTSSFLTTTISDIAIIRTLKGDRIAWSKILNEIDTLTVEADPTFGKGLFETLQEGILYTGYEFDSSTNKIVLSGITKTSDARNFRLMSDLIDILGSSPMFEDVEMRSFTKSGSTDEGFTAHFKIDLMLSKESMSVKNTGTVVSSAPVVPVARKRPEEVKVEDSTPNPDVLDENAPVQTDGNNVTPVDETAAAVDENSVPATDENSTTLANDNTPTTENTPPLIDNNNDQQATTPPAENNDQRPETASPTEDQTASTDAPALDNTSPTEATDVTQPDATTQQ